MGGLGLQVLLRLQMPARTACSWRNGSCKQCMTASTPRSQRKQGPGDQRHVGRCCSTNTCRLWMSLQNTLCRTAADTTYSMLRQRTAKLTRAGLSAATQCWRVLHEPTIFLHTSARMAAAALYCGQPQLAAACNVQQQQQQAVEIASALPKASDQALSKGRCCSPGSRA